MANEIKLPAQARTQFGKGAARRIRAAHQVPVVLYGHGTDPVHLTLPGHETLLALRTANALLELQLEDGSTQLALPKQVQRDPIKGFLEHIDLLIVRKGEKVVVEVPVTVTGELADDELVAAQDALTLSVEAPATAIPEGFEVSIEGLALGDKITAADIELPANVTVAGVEDPAELVIVSVMVVKEEIPEDEAAEGDEAEGAEGEAAEGDADEASEGEKDAE